MTDEEFIEYLEALEGRVFMDIFYENHPPMDQTTPTFNPEVGSTLEENARRYADALGESVHTVVVPAIPGVDELTEAEAKIHPDITNYAVVFHYTSDGVIVSGKKDKGSRIIEVLRSRGQEMVVPFTTFPKNWKPPKKYKTPGE